jgi:hypothetical protein
MMAAKVLMRAVPLLLNPANVLPAAGLGAV